MRPHLARCIVLTIVSSGMLLTATLASAQAESPPAVVTEIWMKGEDLAVTRHIPRDRESAQHSYEEVARSMVNIAESRYQECDEQTAEWLHQWALKLTDGRIGSNPRAAGRHEFPHRLPAAPATEPGESDEDRPLRFVPEPDAEGLAIEWPIAAFSDHSRAEEAQHIDDAAELLGNRQLPDNATVQGAKQATVQEMRSQPTGMEGTSSTQHIALPEPAASRREVPLDTADRQVAVVIADTNHDLAELRRQAVPVVLDEGATLFALCCFAAGVACCFVLHALLLFTPVRFTVSRPTGLPSRTPDRAAALAARSREAAKPARHGLSIRLPEPATRDVAPARDKASSIVEEFYSSNIELFAKLAQSPN